MESPFSSKSGDSISYPLLFPPYTTGSTALDPWVEQILSALLENVCRQNFHDKISTILFSGSNMRGDGFKEKSDFDFIIFFKENEQQNIVFNLKEITINLGVISAFLWLQEDELLFYPEERKVQFFLTRLVYGRNLLGDWPKREIIKKAIIGYAIQFKDIIRPLIASYYSATEDGIVFLDERAYVALKRVDDLVIRLHILYENGCYPLRRSDVLSLFSSPKNERIYDFLSTFYFKKYSKQNMIELLILADDVLYEVLKRYVH